MTATLRPPGVVTATAPPPEVALRPGRTALRDITPLAVAVVPFSLAIGATIAESDLSAPVALGGSVLLMAGAAQLTALDQVDAGAGAVVAVCMALMVNSRLVLYSAALTRWFHDVSLGRRLLLAIPLIDQTFLLGERRFGECTSPSWRQRYYLTATAVLLACFVGSQIAGYHVGAGVPDELGLHLAAPLAFAGMLGMAARGRANITAAAVAAAVLVLGAGVLGGIAVPIAALVGVAAGSVEGGVTRRSRP